MENFKEMNKAQLRAACKAAGIKGYGKMNNAQMAEQLDYMLTPVIGDFVFCPHCGIHLDNGCAYHDPRLGAAYTNEEYEYACLGCGGEFGPAIKSKAKSKPKAQAKDTDHSTVLKPTKLVWDIAEKMKAKNSDARRKDVIAACVEAGVALNTARTQYQLWFTATKNSQG